ncbi:MAG: hypothetical protein AAGC84_08450 [Pseudomonas sp.]
MVSLSAVETAYFVLAASAYWLAGGTAAGITIGIGCLVCFSFLPCYRILAEGAKHVRLRLLAGNAMVGVAFVFLMWALLSEKKLNEMLLLFVSSCVASKGLRFLVVGIVVYQRAKILSS